jgi:hypothetical protein
VLVALIRTVKTASGATVVRVVWSWRRGSRSIEQIGSAHDEVELATLKTAAAGQLVAGQTQLDLGLSEGGNPWPRCAQPMRGWGLEHRDRIRVHSRTS